MTRTDLPDPVRSALRVAVAGVEHDLTSVALHTRGTEAGPTSDRLLTSWRALVDLLALGPEPEYADCPVCEHTVMREATVCGRCWAKLAPPPPRPTA